MGIDFNKGKYFVSDQSINSVEEDFFGHNDFALTIENIIKTQPIPHNIAIVGEWGLGKSSIIELVKSRLHEKIFRDNKFHVIEINAWKYEKDIFQRVFLKKAWNELGGTEEDWANTLMKILSEASITEKSVPQKDKVEKKTIHEKWSNALNWIKQSVSETVKLLLNCLLLYVFTIVIFFLGGLITYLLTKDTGVPVSIIFAQDDTISPNVFVIRDALASIFTKNIFSTSFFTIAFGLFLKYIDSYRQKKNRTFSITAPVKSSDEYESLLKSKLKDDGCDVLVAVIDDIDRLSSIKMIEALDAIKAFSDIKKCIFIVPFDDSKIKKAYNEKTCKGFSECLTDDYMSCELMLDKLFQYRLELPPLVKKDLIPYTIKLIDNKAVDLKNEVNIISPNFFEETILPILIPTHINTPRTIKKIINNFATNYILIKSRSLSEVVEINTKLKLEIDGKAVQTIAFLSVLQSEFPIAYENLLCFPELIEDIVREYEKPHAKTEYDTLTTAKDDYTKLINDLLKDINLTGFFIRSKHLIKIDRKILMSLIYKSDSLSALKSNGLEYELNIALSNGNAIEALEIIKDIENPAEFLKNELLIGGLQPAVERQFIVAISGMFSKLTDTKSALADLVIEKTLVAKEISVFEEESTIDILDMLMLYLSSNSTSKDEYSKLISAKLETIPLKVELDKDIETISSIFNLLIKENLSLSKNINESFSGKISALKPLDEILYDFKNFIENLDVSFNKLTVFTDYCADIALSYLSIISAKETKRDSYIMKVFADIVDEYITKEKYSELCNDIYVAMQSYLSFSVVKDKVIAIKKRLSNESKCSLIEAVSQIKLTDENAEIILLFVDTIDCEYDISTLAEVDAVLSTCISFKKTDEIVVKIMNQNMIDSLTKTVTAINKNIFTKGNKNTLFAQIFEAYSQPQISEFVSLFSGALAVSEDFENIKKAKDILQCCENATLLSEWLTSNVDSLISNFGSYYSRYQKWAMNAVVIIGKLHSEITTNYRGNYYSYLQSAFTSYPELSLKAWSYLPAAAETDTQTEFIVSSVLSLSDVDLVDVYYTITPREEDCLEFDAEVYFIWLYDCLLVNEIFAKVIETIKTQNRLVRFDYLFSKLCEIDKDKFDLIFDIIVKHIKDVADVDEVLTSIISESTLFDTTHFDNLVTATSASPKSFYYIKINEMNANTKTSFIERTINSYLMQKNIDINLIVHAIGLLSYRVKDIGNANIITLLGNVKLKLKRKSNAKTQFVGYLELMLKSELSSETKEKIKLLML